jgi:hypothetical protein
MRRRKQDGLPVGRQPLDIDHDLIVQDRMSGMSLTDVARKHSISRASVVKWVRQAKQISLTPIAVVSTGQYLAEECAA